MRDIPLLPVWLAAILSTRFARCPRLLLAASIVGLMASAPALAETSILSAPEAAARVASGDLVLLDIRSPEEWEETGLAQGAWPVSMHRPEFAGELQGIVSRYGAERVALICATGGRTGHVAEVLARNGISGVADVSEGMFGNEDASGWIARGLPVVPRDSAERIYEAARASWR